MSGPGDGLKRKPDLLTPGNAENALLSSVKRAAADVVARESPLPCMILSIGGLPSAHSRCSRSLLGS